MIHKRLFILLVVCMTPHVKILAQNKSIEAMKGYSDVLKLRFSDSDLWFKNIEVNLNSLINVTLIKENMNLLVPLHCIEGSDTTVIFCYSKEIKKMKKQFPVKFNDGRNYRSKAVKQFPIRDMSINTNISYDSIFRYMNTNMNINTALFDIDKLLDSDISSNYCCRGAGFNERLKMIYLYFKNGILISEDGPSGTLFYLPY